MRRYKPLTGILITGILLGVNQQIIPQEKHLSPQSKTEVEAKVRAQKLTERQERQTKRNEMLSVPAVEAWQDVKADGSSVTYRRIETPILKPQPVPVAPLSSSSPANIDSAVPSSTLDHRTVMLGVTIYDNGTSLIRWQHQDQIYPVWANADLSGLEGIQSFGQNGLQLTLIVTIGEASGPARVIPAGTALFQTEGKQPPQAVREELAALQDYYLSNKDQLWAQWRERKALAQARAEWEATNPEPPKQEVINFFKIR